MTSDQIIAQMEEMAVKGIPMSPNWYLERAELLVSLMGSETDLLHSLQSTVAKEIAAYLLEDRTVAYANAMVKATEGYLNAQKQKAKVEQINEIIRIAKIQARLKQNEWQNGSL